MQTHIKVLGGLQIALGAMGLFGALVLIVVFGGVAGTVSANADADAAIALPIIGLTGMALVAFLVLFSLPGLIVGIGLLRFRPWARIAGIVMCILSLVMFPFGTAVGVYGLWVLFSSETEQLFAGRPATP
jgi:hypothetical protein